MEVSPSLSNDSKTMDNSSGKKKCSFPLKKRRLRQENSLGELTKSFIDFVTKRGLEIININDIVKKLKVKKRRIYDITNVLEGIGYIRKIQKNQIEWLKKDLLISNDYYDQNFSNNYMPQRTMENIDNNYNKESDNIYQYNILKEENQKLESYIKNINNSFQKLINNPDNSNLCYSTLDDLKFIQKDEQLHLIAIQAPLGTKVEFNSKDNTHIINNLSDSDKLLFNDNINNMQHQIYMETQNGEINAYMILTKNEYNQ